MSFLARIIEERQSTVAGKIIRNVLSAGLRVLIIGPVPFLLTPYILKKLGTGEYGTWAVFLAAVNLGSLADLGLVGTLSKHVSQYSARGDEAALSRLVNTGLVLFCAIAVGLVAGGGMAADAVARFFFRDSPIPIEELVFLLRCGLILAATNIVTLLFSSILAGLQRVDLTSMGASFNVLLSAVLSAIFLSLSLGIRGLLFANLAGAVTTLLMYAVLARKLLPSVHIGVRYFELAEMRTMFSFSLQFYLTQMAVAVHNQVEKLYLGRLVGVVPAGWYEISADAALKLRAAQGLLLGPLIPAASELAARRDHRRATELYFRAHKYLALLGLPLIAYMVLVADRFIRLWLGPGFEILVTPFRVLLIMNYFNLLTGPGYLILVGSGILRPGVYSAFIGIVLNVVVSFLLIYWYGFPGAVVGTSVSLFVASALFVHLYHRQTGHSFSRLVREAYLKPLACVLVLVLLMRAIVEWRQAGWATLAGHGLLFAVLYFVGVSRMRFFDEFDLGKLQAYFPAGRLLARLIPVA